MNPLELIQTLEGIGISLTISGDRLKVNAPRDVLTFELRDAILSNKMSLMELISWQNGNVTDMDWADRTAKLKKQVETISTQITRGMEFLDQVVQRSSQDTPEFNRYFTAWERLLTEEKNLLDALQVAERNERWEADRIGAAVAA